MQGCRDGVVLPAEAEAPGVVGVTAAQVALNWVRARPGVSTVLLGARTVEQLDDNLRALTWSLQPEEAGRLTTISAPGIPIYPYGFLEKYAGVDIWEKQGTRAEPPPIGK